MKPIIHRNQYHTDPSIHDEYFLQFANPIIRRILSNSITVEQLRESKDPHFNDIPLDRWDSIAKYITPYINNERLKEAREFNSLSTRDCILKALAKDLVASSKSGTPTPPTALNQ